MCTQKSFSDDVVSGSEIFCFPSGSRIRIQTNTSDRILPRAEVQLCGREEGGQLLGAQVPGHQQHLTEKSRLKWLCLAHSQRKTEVVDSWGVAREKYRTEWFFDVVNAMFAAYYLWYSVPEVSMRKCWNTFQISGSGFTMSEEEREIDVELDVSDRKHFSKVFISSVVDPEWFIPDPDWALNFPSSGSRQKFRIYADPDPALVI